MKKLRASVLPVLSAVLFAAVFWLTSCQTPMEKYGHLVSELRENVFTAESPNYSVNIVTGKREDPFVMDGHAGGTRDFTVITIDPVAGENGYQYRVSLNGVVYTGEFLPHPFARTYSADIAALSADAEIELTVTANGVSETLAAKSVKAEQMIDGEKAIEIAERKLKNSIDAFRSNGELNCEIYVRLMANPIDNSGGYYWYVAFIGENQEIYAALIDPVSMAILAVRD